MVLLWHHCKNLFLESLFLAFMVPRRTFKIHRTFPFHKKILYTLKNKLSMPLYPWRTINIHGTFRVQYSRKGSSDYYNVLHTKKKEDSQKFFGEPKNVLLLHYCETPFWNLYGRLLLVTLNSLDKLFALHHLYSALFVCLFVISLICTICHVPYATLSIFLYYYF